MTILSAGKVTYLEWLILANRGVEEEPLAVWLPVD